MTPIEIAAWPQIQDRMPYGATALGVELVVVRADDTVSVLYGRCQHRGALMADGRIEGHNIVCGVHGWDFRYDTGVSAYDHNERLERFTAWVDDDRLFVDGDELAVWLAQHPQPWNTDTYQGRYQDPHGIPEEPHTGLIRQLANDGLTKLGHHGPVTSMGVSREELPRWDDLQFITAQLARRPLLDEAPVSTAVTIGPRSAEPLELAIPLFVSDMSFGALSEEAKVALATGAELAGTGICSGEGGMLPGDVS